MKKILYGVLGWLSDVCVFLWCLDLTVWVLTPEIAKHIVYFTTIFIVPLSILGALTYCVLEAKEEHEKIADLINKIESYPAWYRWLGRAGTYACIGALVISGHLVVASLWLLATFIFHEMERWARAYIAKREAAHG